MTKIYYNSLRLNEQTTYIFYPLIYTNKFIIDRKAFNFKIKEIKKLKKIIPFIIIFSLKTELNLLLFQAY